MNKVTIQDVAKYANTTRSTVSRVLNDSPLVKTKTKEKVLEAMQVLGYKPSRTARSLKSGKSYVLGLVLVQQQFSEVVMNPGFSIFMKVISERAQSEGYNILLITTAGVDYNSYDELIMRHSVDGFIVLSPTIDDTLNVLLNKTNTPFVFNMRFSELTDNCYVTFDDVEGGYTAAKYLLDLGHRDIKLIVGDVKGKILSFNISRISGFKKALQEYDIPFIDDMLLKVPGEMDSSYHFISSLFSQQKPTALILSNEVTAIAALNALSDKGLKIPDDVSLVAFGYPDLFRYTRPSLTTVGQDIVWQGNNLVDMLLQRINDPDRIPSALIKKPELVVRESTKKAR